MSVREPLLASREVSGDEYGRKVRGFLGVYGGLHMIKGNHAPYFTITTEVHQAGFPAREWSGGADHETILRYFPRFADLVALHLSDIDGVPMHAEANGLYFLAGAVAGNLGQRFHYGDADRYPLTMAECRKTFADHLRIPLERAQTIAWEVADMKADEAKEHLAGIVENLRPQWKAEADAAREKYHLAIFGDPWPA